MLEHGQENVGATGPSSHINLVCASAMAMPFVETVFDVVICGFGTHHMDVPQLLSEVRRVLKTGGNLIMADVGASAFWRSFWGTALLKTLLVIYKLGHRGSVRVQAEAFPNVRTADEWRTILSDFGFTNIKITETRARRRWYPCAFPACFYPQRDTLAAPARRAGCRPYWGPDATECGLYLPVPNDRPMAHHPLSAQATAPACRDRRRRWRPDSCRQVHPPTAA